MENENCSEGSSSSGSFFTWLASWFSSPSEDSRSDSVKKENPNHPNNLSSGGSSSSSPCCMKGDKWQNVLYYTPNAENSESPTFKIVHENLTNEFAKYEGTNEQIQEICLYKERVKPGCPKWLGVQHEYVVVASDNFFWSFEKNDKGISVQRSEDIEAVLNIYRGSERYKVQHGKDLIQHAIGREGDKVFDIISWIHDKKYVTRGYELVGFNCKEFARSLVCACVGQDEEQLVILVSGDGVQL